MSTLVLLVDDSPTVRHQIRQTLQQALEIDQFLESEDGLQGFKLLVEHRPDLVICDLVMPTFDGLKFLALRATRTDITHIPVIMLTSEDDTDRKVEVLDRGASDYVTKPFNEKELVARVRVHHRVKVLQDQLLQANTRLESLALTDGLTGLFNRRYFDNLLLRELKRALRYKKVFSIILIDIDHFKQVNDDYGHLMGDEVLRKISRVVAVNVRSVDSVARYGGEELAVVLPETGEKAALEVAERLRKKIAESTYTQEGVTIKRTASLGVATLDTDAEPVGPEELMKRADQALYQGKLNGRNQVRLWKP